GACVTAADGTFDLAVEVPLAVESVEVSAALDAGSSSLFATARVPPAALAPITSVGALVLVRAPECRSKWVPTFGTQPGTEQAIYALATVDDGSGPALYAGGRFTIAGDVAAKSVARWDGKDWSPLGSGTTGTVYALAVFDDGSGPALFAGGDFS